ncbi:hypothetical protein, partial [Vibrio vulnificus]|uniref:hypothetical protein n=1 Tax=Vibrio vulnificus TaxID=672 RepID=UPI0039B6504A
MWLFAPLHPAIIHEDNIRMALSAQHDDLMNLTNPLLLHVHAALAFGTPPPHNALHFAKSTWRSFKARLSGLPTGAFLLEARDLAEE